MATDAEYLAALKTARSAVVAKLAGGQAITEYAEGGVRIKKESPAALLKAIDEQIRLIEPRVETREAGVGCFRGAV